jgi:hypothetical protein
MKQPWNFTHRTPEATEILIMKIIHHFKILRTLLAFVVRERDGGAERGCELYRPRGSLPATFLKLFSPPRKRIN